MSASLPSGRTPQVRFGILKDVVVIATGLTVLYFFPYADLVDKVELTILLLGLVICRFLWWRKPISGQQTAIYLALWYVALDGLDKFVGYGAGQGWELFSAGAGFFVLTYALWHFVRLQRLNTVIPIVILLFPISRLPFDIARNLYARNSSAPAVDFYVTKIEKPDIYGVSFESETATRQIVRTSEGEDVLYVNDTKGLGAGTMPPQYANTPLWYRRLVRFLLG